MCNAIAIIGSLRKDSVNRKIFNHYRDLAQDHFKIEEGSIDCFPHYNQDIQDDTGIPANVMQLSEKIRAADGVLFFSPEYNYSIPGVLKNALDWLSRVDNQPFSGKVGAIIGASPGGIGTARMQYDLRKVGVFLNIQFINRPEVIIGGAYDKVDDERVTDEKTIEFLNKHILAFKEAMENHESN